MHPDRWRQITALFHEALARDDRTRDTFLEDACRQDPSLREEVERLLASHRDASTFGERSASRATGHLTSGALFGPYVVSGLLGAGGMGEVYRARDPKLGRDVAIKVLPADVTGDPDRLARFTREARLLASLNHPNIGAIYEVEEAAGVQGLVLELIDGPTLADRLATAAMPVREVARHRQADRGGARGRAREKHRPPRSQAGQHQADARGRRQSHRFRHREGRRPRGPGCRNANGTRHRHGRVHEPGAGARRIRRQAHGHLGVWLRALRDVDGPAAVRGQHVVGHSRAHPHP